MKVSRKHIWRIGKDFKWSEWLDRNVDPNDICDPSIDPQMALDIICEYLLPEYSERDGCGWISTISESKEQANSVIVNSLLNRYSKSYKRELKERRKKIKPSIFTRFRQH